MVSRSASRERPGGADVIEGVLAHVLLTAAVCVHDVNLALAVAIARERDCPPVG